MALGIFGNSFPQESYLQNALTRLPKPNQISYWSTMCQKIVNKHSSQQERISQKGLSINLP